jgi:hypothetical protein
VKAAAAKQGEDMHILLTILGIFVVMAALRRLGECFKVKGLGVILIFGLGVMLVRFWPVFLLGLALASSLFLWWLVFRFLGECLGLQVRAEVVRLPGKVALGRLRDRPELTGAENLKSIGG